MSMRELQHYTVRFRESQRLRYRLPRLAWRFVTRLPPNRATHRELDRVKIRLARKPTSQGKADRATKQRTPNL
jgi:hypothetical protein